MVPLLVGAVERLALNDADLLQLEQEEEVQPLNWAAVEVGRKELHRVEEVDEEALGLCLVGVVQAVEVVAFQVALEVLLELYTRKRDIRAAVEPCPLALTITKRIV